MGIKSDTKSATTGAIASKPTAEQLRMAQLSGMVEGSSDEISNSIQKLIKRVIETTRCSQSQAELALFDHDNNLEEAVNYIIENQNNTDSWTELKKKGDKKKDDEPIVSRPRGRDGNAVGGGVPFAGRSGRGGISSGGGPRTKPGGGRGRGAAAGTERRSDRPTAVNGNGEAKESASGEKVLYTGGGGRGEGRGGGRGRGASRGGPPRGAGGRGGSQAPTHDYGSSKTTDENAFKDDYNDWKNGPKVFSRTEESAASGPALSALDPLPAASSSAAAAQPLTSTQFNPKSFAAIAAAAHRKEELRKMQAQQPPARARSPPNSVLAPSSASNIQNTPTKDSAFEDTPLISKTPSTANRVKDSPAKDAFGDESSLHTAEPLNMSANSANVGIGTTASPGLQASAIASQLKSELGIGLANTSAGSGKENQATTSGLAPQPPAGVEFVSDAIAPVGSSVYSFGFVDVPVDPPTISSFNTAATITSPAAAPKLPTSTVPAPSLSPVGAHAQAGQQQTQQSATDALFAAAARQQAKLEDRTVLSNGGDYAAQLKSAVPSGGAPAVSTSAYGSQQPQTQPQQQVQQQQTAQPQQSNAPQPPATGNATASHGHRLDFTTHSSVSYAPAPAPERISSQNKPAGFQQSHQQQGLPQQSSGTALQQPQSSVPQPVFAPPFTGIPTYPYMFSPVTGVRDPTANLTDPYTAAMLSSYPFSSIGTDFVNNFVNPTNNTQPQQQQHGGGAPHRTDSGQHLMDMSKYGTTGVGGLGAAGREQHSTGGSSGVAPPPGFSSNYMQPNIGSLFMPTHHTAYSAPFPGLNMMSMMPPAAGRQMYGAAAGNAVMGAFAGIGDDDRNKQAGNAYDKNKQQAQATPPPYNTGLYAKKPPQQSPYQWQ